LGRTGTPTLYRYPRLDFATFQRNFLSAAGNGIQRSCSGLHSQRFQSPMRGTVASQSTRTLTVTPWIGSHAAPKIEVARNRGGSLTTGFSFLGSRIETFGCTCKGGSWPALNCSASSGRISAPVPLVSCRRIQVRRSVTILGYKKWVSLATHPLLQSPVQIPPPGTLHQHYTGCGPILASTYRPWRCSLPSIQHGRPTVLL
jgi:hypothetical protein